MGALAVLNRRANIITSTAPTDHLWRDRQTGEMTTLLIRRDGRYYVALFGESVIRADGLGDSAREAYRQAYRQQRLARHSVPDLLRERAGLHRMLVQAQRKVAALGALQLQLYDEMGRLRARNAELERELERCQRLQRADDMLTKALSDECERLRARE